MVGLLRNKEFQTLAALFMLYSFGGATLEHASYCYDKYGPCKTLCNPIITGFPLYGVGALLVIYLDYKLFAHRRAPLLLKFAVFATVLTALEYVVGRVVGAGPKSYDDKGNVIAWDYSKERFNYQGVITLRHFISWGVLGVVVSETYPWLRRKVSAAVRS